MRNRLSILSSLAAALGFLAQPANSEPAATESGMVEGTLDGAVRA